jgi:hypothetical protein
LGGGALLTPDDRFQNAFLIVGSDQVTRADSLEQIFSAHSTIREAAPIQWNNSTHNGSAIFIGDFSKRGNDGDQIGALWLIISVDSNIGGKPTEKIQHIQFADVTGVKDEVDTDP